MKISNPFKQKSKSSVFKNLPVPPEPIDDRSYLATALGAAQADKKSGAYDEFLFSENSLVEMPFEESAENYLRLISKRLEDQGRWENLSYEKEVLQLEAKIYTEKTIEAQLASDLAQVEKLIDREQTILDGDEVGRHGLYWKDSLPRLTSRPGGILRLMAPYAVFILVGIVDLGILYFSINNIPGIGGFEVWAFTAPAVGVSLVVPHFIGDRINLLVHGDKNKRFTRFELTLLVITWILFVYAMTQVRMVYLLQEIEPGSSWTDPQNEIVLQIMNFLMLAGLGAWLIFLAARRNPHQNNLLRLELRHQNLAQKLEKSTTTLVQLQSKLPSVQLQREASEASVSANLTTATEELMKATKSTYRRALINEFGSTDFTSSYFKNR
jgi:CII-binding regulator of phage lambda lysogenization HflD